MKLKINFYDENMYPEQGNPTVWEIDTTKIVGMNGRRLAAGVSIVEVYGNEPESNVVITEGIYFRRFEWPPIEDQETPEEYFAYVGRSIEEAEKHIYHAWLENHWLTASEVCQWANRMGVYISPRSIAYNVSNGKLAMNEHSRIALGDAYRFICNWYDNPPKTGRKPTKGVFNG